MTTAMILRTLFEIALVGFALWALFHEDRFAAAERRLFAYIRRRMLKVMTPCSNSYSITRIK